MIKLGVITDTLDMSGKILVTRTVGNLGIREVKMVLDKLRGEIKQIPPVYSSAKYKGKPSYSYARKGQKINLKPKNVIIYNLEPVSLKGDMLTIKVKCSSGTYIRSLAYEIGELLGPGASVKELKRTVIGDYALEDSIKIKDFLNVQLKKNYPMEESWIISIEKLLQNNVTIYIKDKFISLITDGQPVTRGMIETGGVIDFDSPDEGSLVKIKDSNGNFLAVHQILSKKKLNHIKDKDLRLTRSIIVFGESFN